MQHNEAPQYVRWPERLCLWATLRANVAAATKVAKRRALLVSDGGVSSFRDMSTLGSLALDEVSPFFKRIYHSLTPVASVMAGVPLTPVADSNEQYVLNVLDRPYDEQGWHRDSYSYALNAVVSAPYQGGRLQIFEDGTVRSFRVEAGTLMLIKTSTYLHRVEPVTAGVRAVFNMSYHLVDEEMAAISYSSNGLYGR